VCRTFIISATVCGSLSKFHKETKQAIEQSNNRTIERVFLMFKML
jgi:hypothetical protein